MIMNLNIYRIYRKIRRRKDYLIFMSSFIFIVMAIFIIPKFFPNDYYSMVDYYNVNKAPSLKHIFGTDALGRDVFVRVLEASKLSLEIALITALVSVFIGTVYGVISGFYGGNVDSVMMRIVDGLYAIPFIFLAILLVSIFGNNFFLIFISIGCVSWLDTARVIRGQTLEIKNKEYITAAKIMGLSNYRIITSHILHNLTHTIIIFTTLTIPSVLYVSVFLGYLGFGVQPPLAGLGELIYQGSEGISCGFWWRLVFPCIFMIILVLLLNTLNNIIKELISSDV